MSGWRHGAVIAAPRSLGRVGPAVVVVAALAAMGAAAMRPDPWARVPAFPTSCYHTSDDFMEKLTAASVALQEDRQKQQSINDKISEELKSMDPMALASRQQQWMMENPQQAMELMQRNQELGQTHSDDMAASVETSKRLFAELDGINARYKASLDAHLNPFIAKYKDLETRAAKDPSIQNEAGTYMGWALREYNGLIRQENAAYEQVCAEYWAATGPYHGWLKRFKEVLKDRIPKQEAADAVAAGFVAVMISTPDASWQSTAALDAAVEYTRTVERVLGQRKFQPRPLAE